MSNETHIVKAGDTLWKISNSYKVPVKQLISINPALKKNPNFIRIGQTINLVSNTKNSTKPPIKTNKISKMEFDGKHLIVYSDDKNRIIATYSAMSGLPPKAPHLQELINEGRDDLDINTDYTKPKYQDVKDVGPIQEDSYTLQLKKNMPFDKSATAGDGAGWGEGGWLLTENTVAKLGNLFGGRFGFFIHHDGGNRGTSGCIGLKYGHKIQALKILLLKAQIEGQTEVDVIVKYK